MIIGLLGLAFDSGNKGCEALGYGFLQVLQDIAEKKSTTFEIRIFEVCDIEKIYNNSEYHNLILKSIFVPGIGSIKHIKDHLRTYGNCDVVFDFTAGDSFSDIYGMERFIRRTVLKILAIKSSTVLVLGSQTYGPYKSIVSKILARYVLRKSFKVFARDSLSANIVKRIANVEAIQTLDVAFAMPYQQEEKKSRYIGFNPSGLLWSGGYTGDNQFNLTVEYKSYCRETIKILVGMGYIVVFVPHVLSKDMSQRDNDIIACNELHEEFPETIMGPYFEDPISAKSFISGLELFIGARMHATIAAISTGVPVLPFSYSRKFEGLFSGLQYNYVISATRLTTEEAIQKTRDFIDQHVNIHNNMPRYQEIIQNGLIKLTHETELVLNKCKKDMFFDEKKIY